MLHWVWTLWFLAMSIWWPKTFILLHSSITTQFIQDYLSALIWVKCHVLSVCVDWGTFSKETPTPPPPPVWVSPSPCRTNPGIVLHQRTSLLLSSSHHWHLGTEAWILVMIKKWWLKRSAFIYCFWGILYICSHK